MLVVCARDDLISLAALPAAVLASEKEHIRERAKPTNGDICEDDAVAKAIPRLVPGAILWMVLKKLA